MLQQTLDYLLESRRVSLAILCVIALLPVILVGLFNRRSIISTPFRKFLCCLFSIPVILFFIFTGFGHYGYANHPVKMITTNDLLCFMDRQDGGGGNSIIHYRIHVLNPETGEENIRFYAGTNAKLLDEQNNILLYKNDRDNFHLFDLTKNSPAQSYTKESLSAQFPELSSGIDKIQYENDDQPYSGSILSITSKTGKNYFFNPFSSKLTDSVSIQKKDQLNSDPPDKYEIKLRNSENKVIEINLVNSPNSSVLWRLEAINNEQKQKDNESKEFINACFIAAYPDLGIILIKSFETTDENNFLITAISPDMKKLWQISQKQMEESDYDSKHKNTASITFKSNLILNAYHFYFSLNAQTGKVNWKKSI